jgi:hypothetical protein
MKTPHARIVDRPPEGPDRYVHRTPVWLQGLVRSAFMLAAAGLIWLAHREWISMPLPARLLVGALVPAFAVFALWQRPWRCTVRFVADQSGVWFPDNAQQVLSRGMSAAPRWLHVDWFGVTRLRVARSADDGGGLCIAMDVAVPDAHRDEFFRYVGAPQGEEGMAEHGVLRIAYDDRPPHPRQTVARLEALRGAGIAARPAGRPTIK